MNLKKKMLTLILPTALLATFLTACDNNKEPVLTGAPVVQQNQQQQQQQPQVVYEQPAQQQQPQVVYEQAPQQQPQVVVVEQPPQVVYRDHSSGITAGHVAAGALGYLAGKHMSGGSRSYSSRRPAVVNHYHYSAPKRSRSYFGSRGRRR